MPVKAEQQKTKSDVDAGQLTLVVSRFTRSALERLLTQRQLSSSHMEEACPEPVPASSFVQRPRQIARIKQAVAFRAQSRYILLVSDLFKMGNAFGETKSQKQIIREQQRMVDRSMRGLERDRLSLQQDEKRIVSSIKKAAKANQIRSVRTQTKDLIRIRKQQDKFDSLTAQLRAISMQMTSIASISTLSESLQNVSKSMTLLNAQVDLPQLKAVIRDFAKQSASMEMKNGLIEDTLEDTLDDAEDEMESDQVVNQVLDEIGISLSDGFVDVPRSRIEQQDLQTEVSLTQRLGDLQH